MAFNSALSGSTRSIAVFLIAGGLGAYALWMWISSFRDRSRRDLDTGSEASAGVATADVPTWDPAWSAHTPPRQHRPLAYSQCPEPPTAYSADTRPFPTIE